MRILIADDHAIVRSGLKYLVSDLADDVTVVEAATMAKTLEICRVDPKPDLVVFDLNMPGMERGNVLPELVNQAAPAPTVVFSMDETPDRMRSVLSTGVKGYIPKSTDDRVVSGILQMILAGGTYVPPILAMSRNSDGATAAPSPVARSAISSLTRRQREVLALLSEGMTNMEIGERLGLNLSTVKTHVTGVLKTLGVDNRTQAVLAFKQVDRRG